MTCNICDDDEPLHGLDYPTCYVCNQRSPSDPTDSDKGEQALQAYENEKLPPSIRDKAMNSVIVCSDCDKLYRRFICLSCQLQKFQATGVKWIE